MPEAYLRSWLRSACFEGLPEFGCLSSLLRGIEESRPLSSTFVFIEIFLIRASLLVALTISIYVSVE